MSNVLSKMKDPFLLLILLFAGIGYLLPVSGSSAMAGSFALTSCKAQSV